LKYTGLYKHEAQLSVFTSFKNYKTCNCSYSERMPALPLLPFLVSCASVARPTQLMLLFSLLRQGRLQGAPAIQQSGHWAPHSLPSLPISFPSQSKFIWTNSWSTQDDVSTSH